VDGSDYCLCSLAAGEKIIANRASHPGYKILMVVMLQKFFEIYIGVKERHRRNDKTTDHTV
jgi:hypothetical protein